jgi:hypothetical protein
MACTPKKLTPIDLQAPELLLPDGLGMMRVVRTVREVLCNAFELRRELQRRYPTNRMSSD